MMGALVFLVFFMVFLAATLAFPFIPPGSMLYGLSGIPETEVSVLGIRASLLIEAILNGVIYGVIAWLIFSLVRSRRRAANQA